MQPLLVWRRVVEDTVRQQFAGHERRFVEWRLAPVRRRPAVQPAPAVVDFVELHVVRIFVAPVAVAVHVGISIRGVAHVADVNDGGKEFAVGLLCRLNQRTGQVDVAVLQGVKRQTGFAVVVVEQPDELVAGGFVAAPANEVCGNAVDMVCVVRRLPGRQRVIGAHAQVEHQRQSMAVPNRPGLMGAVRIESGEGQFGGFLDVGLDHGFPLPVPNDQLAASAFGRQSDGQGRDHAVCLLRIPMRGEEAALFVDQQLVQAGFKAFDSAAESLRHGRHDAGEGVRPGTAGETSARRVNLPAVAHRGVHQRVLALAVRCSLGNGQQGAKLRQGHGEGEHAHALHFQARHGGKQATVGAEVARVVDGTQQIFQRLVAAVLEVDAHSGLRLAMNERKRMASSRPRQRAPPIHCLHRPNLHEISINRALDAPT